MVSVWLAVTGPVIGLYWIHLKLIEFSEPLLRNFQKLILWNWRDPPNALCLVLQIVCNNRQLAPNALFNPFSNSKFVEECKLWMNYVGVYNLVYLTRVPGFSPINGNDSGWVSHRRAWQSSVEPESVFHKYCAYCARIKIAGSLNAWHF